MLHVHDPLTRRAEGGEESRGGIGGRIRVDERMPSSGKVVALDVDEEQESGHGISL